MLLSIGQVTKKYSLSRTTLKALVANGKLTEVKTPGGHYRFLEVEIQRVLGIEGLLK